MTLTMIHMNIAKKPEYPTDFKSQINGGKKGSEIAAILAKY
jgi:hypothetical protein